MSKSKIDADQVLVLRTAGLSFRAVAERLGCSATGVMKVERRALAAVPVIEDATNLRLILAMRYESIYGVAMRSFAAGNVRAGTVAIRATTDLARLFGIAQAEESTGMEITRIEVASNLTPPTADEPIVSAAPAAVEAEHRSLDRFLALPTDGPRAWEPPPPLNGHNGH